jgi:hypothetical protein
MTTPASARTALARLRGSIDDVTPDGEHVGAHADANAAEVLAAIDAWEKLARAADGGREKP